MEFLVKLDANKYTQWIYDSKTASSVITVYDNICLSYQPELEINQLFCN